MRRREDAKTRATRMMMAANAILFVCVDPFCCFHEISDSMDQSEVSFFLCTMEVATFD